jgi:hypothetical protein
VINGSIISTSDIDANQLLRRFEDLVELSQNDTPVLKQEVASSKQSSIFKCCSKMYCADVKFNKKSRKFEIDNEVNGDRTPTLKYTNSPQKFLPNKKRAVAVPVIPLPKHFNLFTE